MNARSIETLIHEGGRIAVVIVTFKSQEWLSKCLDSILEDTNLGACIIIDNDGSGRDHASLRRITYLRSPSNIGFGAACNLGFELIARSSPKLDIIATINPDTWMEPGWGGAMLQSIDSNPEHGILAPLQLTYDFPGTLAPWTCATLGHHSLITSPLLDVTWAEGSALFVRRELILKLGGFDSLFPLYYEEVDLCRRARLVGQKIAIVTTARYHHATGGSFNDSASPLRNALKDVGQAIFILTEPHQALLPRATRLARLVLKRACSWITGKNSSFPRFCATLALRIATQSGAIATKRKRDAKLATNDIPRHSYP